jgi:regulator of protease activity HflC (stomatin/prohibitin superfamily)
MQYMIAAAIAAIVLLLIARFGIRRMTVYEFERGLRYVRGKFKAVLQPGQYWYLPWLTSLRKVDVRPRFASIAGQEVLSGDGVTLKISLAANYEVVKPDRAVNNVQNFQETFYLELQLALRLLVGSVDIDSLMTTRDEISRKLAEMTQAKAEELGLRLISVGIRDITFPGKLKEVFAQVVGARKEGLAVLEKARGETAALRNLANAAKMIESNPSLMQLRVLQTLGASSGNTLVLGLSNQTGMLPIKPASMPNKETSSKATEESE